MSENVGIGSTIVHAPKSSGQQDPSASYSLAVAFLLGFVILAAAVWISAGNLAQAVNEVNSTLMAKEFTLTANIEGAAQNTAGGAAAQQNNTAAAAATAKKINLDISTRAIKGAPTSGITIVEFSEFLCPYCSRAQSTMEQIKNTYGSKVNFAHVNYIVHAPSANISSEAAECAGEQGKYWEMHDEIFNTSKTDEAGVKELAAQLGLDETKFAECLSGTSQEEDLAAQQAVGSAIGIRGTPSFVIFSQKKNSADLADLSATAASIIKKYSDMGASVTVTPVEVSGKGYGIFLVGALPYEDFETVISSFN